MDLVIANFPLYTLATDVTILLMGGLEANILSITQISRCQEQYGNCNRTRLSILVPAVDPPGNWAGELSIKGISVLKLNLEYFAPCNFEQFCETEGKIVNKHRLETRVPTSASCDPQYCLNVALLLTPSIVSFFPSEGPSTGGTMVTVTAKNLPAFRTSDLTIEVGTAASKQSLPPQVIRQDSGSSTTASSGVFIFKVPPVMGGVFGILSETSVLFKVALGMNIRSAGFRFRYTPVIQGPAVVASFYPLKAFPTVDVEVKVQLINFPKLLALTPRQVRVQFENVPDEVADFAATAIETSSFAGTLISFKTGARLKISGMITIKIYYEVHGLARSGNFKFEVLAAPTPTIFSMFPLRGRANVVLNEAVTVQYIDPLIAAQATWTVALSGLVSKSLASPVVTDQSTPGCTQRYCAKYQIQFVVPKDYIPLDGGEVNVTIAADTEQVVFGFYFDADDTPSVESVDPVSMGIEETETKVVKVHLKNVNATFCSDFAACTVMFGGSKGNITGAVYANQLLTVTIKPPAIGAGGFAPGLITYNGVEIKFDYTFIAPPASLEPIDGACAGGETLTFEVLGWGQVVLNANSIRVVVGSKEATVLQIISSVASASFSSTKFQVTSPILGFQGLYSGVISSGTKSSSFVYECFDAPTSLASPAAATLDGRTSSGNGKSVTLLLGNFPKIATTGDVEVRFGDVLCDATRCSVVSFSNGESGVTLVVTPPKVSLSANVLVSARYTGKAEPPKDGDPSKTYVRAQKTARTAFSHFRPNPVILSAKWCQECVLGSRTCIANGRCFKKIKPKINAMGSSGSGVLTVVADNFPQIPIDLASGTVVASAGGQMPKVEVSFGDYFGRISKVLYSDETRSSFELVLSSPVAIGRDTMSLSVFEDESSPVSYSARLDMSFFDENIAIVCVGICQGPSTGSAGGNVFRFAVENLAVISSADVMVSFGDQVPPDLTLVSSSPSNSTFSISMPSYGRSYTNGIATVQLSIAFASDRITLASALFSYYAPPSFESIRFSSTGTSIDTIFDQPTDRAGMTAENTMCELILSSATVATLGTGSKCVWSADNAMTIFLGDIQALVQGVAAISPGNAIHVLLGVLKSRNKVSPFSAASAVVARPLVVLQPEVSVKGTDTIDPCSSLEVRASVLSPRDASVTWACSNDKDLNSYLATVSSSTLFLPIGTSQMTTFPKEYAIEVNVVDFLGVQSVPVIFRVLKKVMRVDGCGW